MDVDVPHNVSMEKDLGRIRVPESQLPAVHDWKIGGKYTVMVEVEQVGANKERDYGDLDSGPVSLKEGSKEPKYRTMYEFKIKAMRPQAKDKSKLRDMAHKIK